MKLTLASLLLTLSAFGQEHAPTVEQCRADAKLWFSERPCNRKLSTTSTFTKQRRVFSIGKQVK